MNKVFCGHDIFSLIPWLKNVEILYIYYKKNQNKFRKINKKIKSKQKIIYKKILCNLTRKLNLYNLHQNRASNNNC